MNTVAPGQPGAVAEIQGLYGPFSFPERLLQKIWLQGDFDRVRAFTLDGVGVKVRHPGRWNLLGGPDFKCAQLQFGDGPLFTTDVELHLHAADWAAHGHAEDPAYDGVGLHVVLFAPPPGHVTSGRRGPIPVLALLPILLHDLEEYAAEDAVELLANRPAGRILERLGAMPREQIVALLDRQAENRWRQKVHFARLRIQRLGWTEACHQTALEILGYRFNRAPMLRLATSLPLGEWSRAGRDSEAVFAREVNGWSLQGLRPANHPRRRLRQYASWVAAVDDWPAALLRFGSRLPRLDPAVLTGVARRGARLASLREEFTTSVCGGAIDGTRFDTLVCDGFLPLLSARTETDLHVLWRSWFPGDLPPVFARGLRQLGVFRGPLEPSCHGATQGLLGWLLEEERREAVADGRGA